MYFLSPSALPAGPSPSGATPVPPAKGHGTLTEGSPKVTGLTVGEGRFTVGMGITGTGIPDGTTVTAVNEEGHTLTLSQKASASGSEELVGDAQNLYFSNGAATRFVATVSQLDAMGEPNLVGTTYEGLALWTEAVQSDNPAILSSRTSVDGVTLLFRSDRDLTAFSAGGKAEIYRYSVAENTLRCVSCSPAGDAPSGDAHLLNANPGFGTSDKNNHAPPSFSSIVPNLSANGRRAFYQTPERLVPSDNDGLVDVYEWEANGEGTCATPGGCLFLVSSGQSAHPNYIFGVSDDGSDVFIRTTDILNGEDGSETPSVYDARVNGGFPPPPNRAAECLGEACQPASSAPSNPPLSSSSFKGAGNVHEEAGKRRCPKGKRAVRSHGKRRCIVKKHRHKHKRSNHTHRKRKHKHRHGPKSKKHSKRTNINGRTGR